MKVYISDVRIGEYTDHRWGIPAPYVSWRIWRRSCAAQIHINRILVRELSTSFANQQAKYNDSVSRAAGCHTQVVEFFRSQHPQERIFIGNERARHGRRGQHSSHVASHVGGQSPTFPSVMQLAQLWIPDWTSMKFVPLEKQEYYLLIHSKRKTSSITP